MKINNSNTCSQSHSFIYFLNLSREIARLTSFAEIKKITSYTQNHNNQSNYKNQLFRVIINKSEQFIASKFSIRKKLKNKNKFKQQFFSYS